MSFKFPAIDITDREDDRILYWDDTAKVHKYKDEEGGVGGGGVAQWALAPDAGAAHSGFIALGAANRAIYVPVTLQGSATITGVRIRVGNSSGTISVGLYDSTGTQLATSGSVACPSAGHASVSFGSNYAASAGRYYLAISASSNSATFSYSGASSTAGPFTSRFEESAHPLPATASMSNDALPINLIGLISGGYPV